MMYKDEAPVEADGVDPGEQYELAADFYDVNVFGFMFRAWPPPVSAPRIQRCPRCDEDCREERRDLWTCDLCGYVEDNRPLIRKDMPRRKRRKRKVVR